MDKNLINSYRGNSEGLKILDSLETVSKKWSGLPISFYIADCDIELLTEILRKLGYPSSKVDRQPTGRNSFAILIYPRG